MSVILRRILLGVIGLVVLMLLVSALPRLLAELLFRLPFGWIAFLLRVLPQVTPSPGALGFGLICSVLIIAGLHWIAAGFHRHRSGPAPGASRWRWSWSVALYAMLWCLFLAAMGITGLTHQVVWLVHSREPVLVPERRVADSVGELMVEAAALRLVAEEADWRAEAVRKRYLAGLDERMSYRYPQGDHREHWQTVFVADGNGGLEGAFLFHRDAARREQAGFVVVSRDSTSGPQPGSTLPEALRHVTGQAQAKAKFQSQAPGRVPRF